MSAPASKIKGKGEKTLYFLAKILYIIREANDKKCLILLREVSDLAISFGVDHARL